jgi:serine protease Do
MRLRLLGLGLAAAMAAPVVAVAADPPVTPPTKTSTTTSGFAWDTARVTSPESVDELKALQGKVKTVYQKSLPVTVALLMAGGPGGGSAGSGVIVSNDGLVLTAAHVIGRPRDPVVFELSDGRRVKGISLGLNTLNDSGMAKITEPPPKDYPGAKDGKWPFAEIGPSADLKKGQWIVSMGHPGGPKTDRPPPVRTGRVVSFDKASPPFRRNDLICTDGTLVGGDSGGPLFDLDGKVVGIHSEIGETLDQNRHVPTEKFKDEWDRMARGDILYYRRGSTPESTATVTLNVTFDKKAAKARIEELTALKEGKGAAEKAGLEAGDVIVKFNGHAVKSADDLTQMMPSYKVGETVKVEVDRDGSALTFDVKLADKTKK